MCVSRAVSELFAIEMELAKWILSAAAAPTSVVIYCLVANHSE
jgi:hypothetical protein